MFRIFRKRRMLMSSTRRGVLKFLAALPMLTFASWPAVAKRTPSAAQGPFYPRQSMLFTDTDNDLVKIIGKVEEAGGEVILLSGRVRDGAGRPVVGARVEIWQCDVNGRYLHTADRSGGLPADPAFQGFGHVVTDSEGAYAFRTIKPVPYTGRTPHIHVNVIHARRKLTTQFYIAGHAHNSRDWLFQHMSAKQQRAVSMDFSAATGALETAVDIVL